MPDRTIENGMDGTPTCPVAYEVARMMEAAPELLQACRHARDYFQAHAAVERNVDRADHLKHHLGVMERAIAKVEGRTGDPVADSLTLIDGDVA